MTLIDKIKRDREAGTPGPWRLGSWGDNIFGTGPNDEWLSVCRVKRDDAPLDESPDGFDARRIARVPDMESALLVADELAKACESAFDGIDATGPQEFYLALAAWNAATKGEGDT